MKKEFLAVLSIAAIIGILFSVYPIFSATSSPYSVFTVVPDFVFLNWTNGYSNNFTITVGSFNNVNFTIFNSTALAANYSQTGCSNYNLLVENATGLFFSSTAVFNTGNIINISLVDAGHLTCSPGRYRANAFTITNSSGVAGDNASIAIISDIPISSNNTLSGGVGTFSGSLPGNATTYQSFYFNTSFNNFVFGNATAIAVNLTTTSPQVAQIFLFDSSGTMKAKSINASTSQYLSYYPLPSSPAMWEIRVYGNSTSSIPYTGAIIYSTLNAKDSSDTNEQIFNISYEKLNVSQNIINNITLINQGILNLSNVAFTDNIYRIQKFTGSGTQSFPFLVGDSNVESKVRVALHWTGNSNYTLNVYDPPGNLVMSSSNYNTLAKAAGATSQELYNETTLIVPGYWNVSVVSNSGSDTFNLNIFTFENNLQNWISTNYLTTTFNGVHTNGTIQLNLTIPNATIDGSYQGNLLFTDSNGGQITIPIYFNVTTPTLLVLNATFSPTTMNPFSSGTFRQDENYGANLTRTINFNISNIGSFDQVINASVNSTNLTCSICGFRPDMSSNITSITSIPAHSSALFQVNITYNSSFPVNTYFGWIFINAADSSNFVLNSHPYSSYNLTLELNLTNALLVKNGLVLAASGSNIANGTVSETAMQAVNVYFVNGTEITTLGLLNFTRLWLQEKNVTTSLGTVPNSTGGLATAIATGGSLYCSGSCSNFVADAYDLNFTIPANLPGGTYAVYDTVSFTNGTNTYTGQGVNSSTLIINKAGLFMSTNTSGSGCGFDSTCASPAFSMGNPNSTLTVYAKVANYGPVAATGATINYTTTCTGYTFSAAPSSSGCGSATYSTTGNTWTVTVPAYNTSCVVTWYLTARSSSAGSPSCAVAYLMGGNSTWFDPNGVNITITVNNVTSSSNTGNTDNNNINLPGTSAAVYVLITNYPTILYVVQNSTNSTLVNVKNANSTKTQDIGLSITNLTSSWYSISPTIRTSIAPLVTTNFTISFNIPSSAAVADYLTNLTASSNYGSSSQLFTLRVLPSESTKININQTYQLVVVNYTNLFADVNRSKAMGMNTTQVEANLVLAKAKLDQTQSYINLGDYFSAQQSLNQAQSLLATAANDFANLNKNPFTGILSFLQGNLLYILISGIAVTAVFIAYLFWPTKSESLDLIMKPKAKPNANEKTNANIKVNANQESSFQKLKSKWSWENLKSKWKK